MKVLLVFLFVWLAASQNAECIDDVYFEGDPRVDYSVPNQITSSGQAGWSGLGWAIEKTPIETGTDVYGIQFTCACSNLMAGMTEDENPSSSDSFQRLQYSIYCLPTCQAEVYEDGTKAATDDTDYTPYESIMQVRINSNNQVEYAIDDRIVYTSTKQVTKGMIFGFAPYHAAAGFRDFEYLGCEAVEAEAHCVDYTCSPYHHHKANIQSLTGASDDECCDADPVCTAYSCPTAYHYKDGYETLIGETTDECCDADTCDKYSCGDDAKATTPYDKVGSTFAECCVCTFGDSLFFGTNATGRYDGSSAPATMRITLPIPADISVSSITWTGAEEDAMSYSSSDAKLWNVDHVNDCRNDFHLHATLPTFFGTGSTWNVDGNEIETTLTIQGTKDVTKMFGRHTEKFTRQIDHSMAVRVALLTQRTVTATLVVDTDLDLDYGYVTGIVDHYKKGDNDIILTLMIKSGSCIAENAAVTAGENHLASHSFAYGDNSWDEVYHCQETVTFTFAPTTCFNDVLTLHFEELEGDAFDVHVDIGMDCETHLLAELPIVTGVTLYASTEAVSTQTTETDFHIGNNVYALLSTSTVVPIHSLEIINVNVTQLDFDEITTVNHEICCSSLGRETYFYNDSYPYNNDNSKSLFQFDLEYRNFRVSEEGVESTLTLTFDVTYEQSNTIRRQLEVDMKSFTTQDSAQTSFKILVEDDSVGTIVQTSEVVHHRLVAIAAVLLLGASWLLYRTCLERTPSSKLRLLSSQPQYFSLEPEEI